MIETMVAMSGRIRAAFRARTRASSVTLVIVVFALALFGAAQLGRLGTLPSRAGGLALLGATLLGTLIAVYLGRRRWRDAREALKREVATEDPVLAQAIDRAAGLTLRSRREALAASASEEAEPSAFAKDDVEAKRMARELADLHLSRQLQKVRVERIFERADRRARVLSMLACAVAAAALALAALDPFRIVEGLDVLLARGGEAPYRLVYLEDVDVVAAPPPYIGRHQSSLDDFDSTEQPRGTILTVRGKPQRPGRELVLTDGVREESFRDDGKGTVVARWTLGDTTTLRIAARFGGVRISQRDELSLESIPDTAPEVTLEGAPKTIKLVDAPKVTLRYQAIDDYGLSETALVLRSGPHEERRTLSKPTGNKTDRGAHELSTQEPFFKNRYVPVEVTVEARDNDAVMGPKWGVSAAFVVLPPLVGEPEALRYSALLKARDALVDLLAPRVIAKIKTLAQAKARVAEEVERQAKAIEIVEEVIAGTYGGLTVRGRVRKVIAGQTRRLRLALEEFEKKPTAESFDKLRTTSEQVVLAVDAAVQRLGVEDARKVSLRLADVADEAALASRAAADPLEQARGLHRLEAALGVLAGGGRELAKIGSLGADIGDIARGGVGRIGRERDAARLRGSELAAIDLARRLRLPVSSIGGGGKPGVESGPGDGSGEGDGEASEADEQAEKDGKELDELIKRHAQEMDKLDKLLEKAVTKEERDALKKLAKEQAQAIREAVKGLPEQGLPGSAAEKAAEGKKRAESMAGSLEKGNIKDALKTGKEALDALREAKKLGEKGDFLDDEHVGKEATGAGNRVEEALEDLKNALDAAEKNAKERASKDMKDAAENEGRMSERTRDLKQRGEKGDSAMPEDVLDRLQQAEQAMKEAQKALKEGDSEQGKEKQQEAQRYLEMAREDDEQDGKREDGKSDGDGKEFDQDAEVPDKDKHKGPEEFRKRVVEGLAKPGDARLKDAVKRYTEGLLK